MALGIVMTNSAFIADLERLEDEIGEVLILEVIDNLTISELKRRKLHLRDEIERLRDESSTPSEPDELLCCRMAILGLARTQSNLGTATHSPQLSHAANGVSFGKPMQLI
jgi:hypothetical protein